MKALQNRPTIAFGLLAVWFLAWYIGIDHHVFWRDEVRALSIANETQSLGKLFQLLENEGHPPLWYILLQSAHQIWKTNLVLPALAFAFAFVNVCLLLFKSPFHWSLLTMIILGQYGLYEYGIIARNYGLATTFLFGFAICSQKRKTILAYLLLCLAAMSNFYALVFANILGLLYLLEHFKKQKLKTLTFWALLLIVSGLCMLLIIPSKDSLVVSHFSLASIPFAKIWDVGWGFNHLFDGIMEFKHGFKTFLLFGMLLIFWKQWKVMAAAFIGMVYMASFHLSVRENFSHHEGMFFVFMITLVWMNWKNIKNYFYTSPILTRTGYAIFALMVCFNFVRGAQHYQLFYNLDSSNADHLGNWLTQNADEQTILIGEPDYDMESVVYYYPKDFYIPREQRFRKYAQFTTANKSELDLQELIQIADSFIQEGLKPLLITQWDLDFWQDTTHHYSYGKAFTVDRETHQIFKARFQRDTLFHQFISTDESYFVYSHKP